MESKALAITLGTMVTLGALGGVSYAAIPNSTNGTITACYATSGTVAGTLKIIDAQSGATCAVGRNQIA